MHRLEHTLDIDPATHDRFANRLRWLCTGRHQALADALTDATSRGFTTRTSAISVEVAADPDFGTVARLGRIHGKWAWIPIDRRCIDGTCLHRGTKHLAGLR